MNGVRYIFVSMTFLHLTTASRLPGQPTDVTLLADSKNIAVQWQAPLQTGGNIRKYIVTWAILPKFTDVRSAIVVDGDVMVAIISVQMDIGRLFRVRVRAENEVGVGPYSSPRYIRIACHRDVLLHPGQTTNITSPGYPRDYPSSVVCTWSVRTEPEAVLRMTILDFRFEDTSFCSSDYVKFSFKPDAECARMDLPRRIDTQKSNFTVTFGTDAEQEFRGFLVTVHAQDETDNKGDIMASVVSTVVTVIIVIGLTAVVCLWRRRRARWKVHVQADSKYRQTRVELYDILLQFSPFYPQPSATRTRRSSFPCCYSVRKSKMLVSRVDKSFSVMGCIEDRETLKQRLERLHRRQRINSV